MHPCSWDPACVSTTECVVCEDLHLTVAPPLTGSRSPQPAASAHFTLLWSRVYPSGLCLLLCALPSWFHSPSSPVLCHVCACVRVCIVVLRYSVCTEQIKRLLSPGSFPGNLCHLRFELPFLPYFHPFPAHSFASSFSTWSLLAAAPAPYFISLTGPVDRLLLPGPLACSAPPLPIAYGHQLVPPSHAQWPASRCPSAV